MFDMIAKPSVGKLRALIEDWYPKLFLAMVMLGKSTVAA
ncbi:hypothetical protein KF282_0836 [Lactococcus lactis subsp. lactis]|uniref:Uncharacterized protein n=1 Tax=Lactococcus lactis subsp. lactis TaxID=1360 RepID=A0A0V8CZJ7_LACLL|nr:hypothetical protein KF282_0836 [Lactococcus lactis subsp. lactis]